MFPRRQKVIDGSIVTDTPINDLVYAETHGVFGANTLPFVFELVRLVKPATCVVIGSGDGLIPRVIREAQIISKAENGRVFLIDLGKSMGALPEKIHDQDSLFRKIYPEIIVFKGKSIPDGLEFIKKQVDRVDVLWIDGDHSYDGSRSDFLEFSSLLSDQGLIFMYDTAPNGAGQRQPPWCGVDRTVRYIKRNHQSFEVLNFTPMKNFQIGTGLAVLKKNLDFKKIKKSDPSINFKPPVTSGKTWDYLYTKQFFLRQRLVASLLEDSNFVLDVGCFPVSVGEYLNHDRYLAVDPLFPGQTENIRNCLLSDISFDKDRDYDIVLLGIDIPVDQNLIDFCCRAQKVVIEWPICYAPSAEKVKSIVRNTKKNLSYDFTMDFSKLPVKIDPAKSWPPRYMRRIIILE